MLAGVFLVAGLSGAVAAGHVELRLRVHGAGRHLFAAAGGTPRSPTLGIVLAALYILLMYQRTMTGPVTPATAEHSRRTCNGAGEVGWRPR